MWADLDKRLDADLEYERTGDLRIAETERRPGARPRARRPGARGGDRARAGRGRRPAVAGARALPPCPRRHLLRDGRPGQSLLLVAPTFGRRARDLGAIVWEELPGARDPPRRGRLSCSRPPTGGCAPPPGPLGRGVDAAACGGARRAAAHRALRAPDAGDGAAAAGARRGAPRGQPQAQHEAGAERRGLDRRGQARLGRPRHARARDDRGEPEARGASTRPPCCPC